VGVREPANKRARTGPADQPAPEDEELSHSLLQLLLYAAHLDLLTGHWAKGQARMRSYLMGGMLLSGAAGGYYATPPLPWSSLVPRR
jgi:hypothetical protein